MGDACWIDGRRVAPDEAVIPVSDPAVHSGLGLFETLAAAAGRPRDLEPHLARMRRGGEQLGIALPDPATLKEAARTAAGTLGDGPGWIRLMVTGGGRLVATCGRVDPSEIGRPVTAVILPWRRAVEDPLVGVKSSSYAANRLGLSRARAQGADEGLWLNSRGHLAEGCSSNLFVVRARKLFTAGERDGILPGVVRSRVVELAPRLGLAVHVGKLRRARLRQADEAFLTSSVRGIRPLVGVDGRPVGTGRPGRWTGRLTAQLELAENGKNPRAS